MSNISTTSPSFPATIGSNENDILKPTNPNMMGLATDYAVSNKFVMYVPLSLVLGKDYKNIEIPITRFTVPQIMIGSMTASFKGVTCELPTKVINPDSKEVTIEYMIDANWENYRSLYVWAANIGIITPVSQTGKTTPISGKDFLDIRIYLLDQYKKKIIEFTYHNCWIKQFNDLNFDYTQPPEELKHSFNLVYTDFTISPPTA